MNGIIIDEILIYNGGKMKFSIIIPVLNEKMNIARITEQLLKLEGDYEVIIADGGSTDGGLEAASEFFTVLSCDRGRALQMNNAAKIAKGEVLLFLHCDSTIETKALFTIEEFLAQGYDAGCFTMNFDGKGFWLSLFAYLSNLRAKLLNIMFGDQGIFIKKVAFENVGGFPDIPIMEDLQFSLEARKHIKIGQCDGKIITSARRFNKNGVFKTIMFMHWLKILYFTGADINKINEMYKNVR